MLKRIWEVIPEGNRRIQLKYMRMIASISDRMCLARNRYLLAHPVKTPGTEMLRYLCANLDITAMDRYDNDEDRYTEVVKFYKDKYRSIFDPNFSGNVRGGKFIKPVGGVAPCEVILNCESENPIMTLPFDQGWEAWQNLRAVRLLYHNSLEMPEEMSQSMIRFDRLRPTYLVIGLDVPILVFKYYKYVVDNRTSHIPVGIDQFIKDNEYNRFFDDLLNIWLMNLVTTVVEDPKQDTEKIIERIQMPIRFCTSSMLAQGIDGIKEHVNLLTTGAIRPQDFMITKWFPDNKSIWDMLDDMHKWIWLPNIQRYLWLKVVNWYPWLYLILTMCRLFPDGPLKSTINKRCQTVWSRKFKMINMCGVNSQLITSIIQMYRNAMEELLLDTGTTTPGTEEFQENVNSPSC